MNTLTHREVSSHSHDEDIPLHDYARRAPDSGADSFDLTDDPSSFSTLTTALITDADDFDPAAADAFPPDHRPGYPLYHAKKDGHAPKGESFVASATTTTNPMHILKRVPGRIPSQTWLIVVTELCERFTYYGASLMFQLYMLRELRLEQSAATAINRGFSFFCYFTTIIGAVVADQYLGKYRTILIFAALYAVGLAILTMSSTRTSIDLGYGLPGFLVGCYFFMGLGTGGMKSNVSAFVAEQIPLDKAGDLVPTMQPGVYIDYHLTVERVFRYFYWAICLGAFIGQIACPLVAQNFSYPLAFLLPTVLFVVAIFTFLSGRHSYINKPPTEAVLIKALRCVKFALRHRQPGQDHWLDPAKNILHPYPGSVSGGGADWDAEFVDSLKTAFRACAVFSFYPFFWAIYGNMGDNFITQALTMKRPAWFPPDQMNALNNLVLVLIIPLFDAYIYPWMNRRGYRMGPIFRITIGFFLAFVTFFYITVLQYFIYSTGPYYDFSGAGIPADPHVRQNDISIWWQAFPCALMGVADFFASATGLEFAYKQAPAQMKSVVVALYLFTSCIGSLMGLVVAYWSRDPNFIEVFGYQSVIMLVVTIVFYYLFHKWDEFM
ncbi:hypothetical protein H4R33_001850 [Dimargaris cristalligena]|nr:hypothetical protein H4R33_001850 [Dimargaris cristalligena]